VGSGALACAEAGGHARPSRNALVAKGIFVLLERALGDSYGRAGVGEPARLAARALLPSLPSFKGEFTAAVPLTRIRDIAHRNDIPQSLKQEIKHGIQNKLHRCAGPEDLAATEAMLARITAPGAEYPNAFVSEFRIFAAELRDFFNASTCFERLEELRPGMEPAAAAELDLLLAARAALEAAPPDTAGDAALTALHAATTVRARLVALLSSGLRNDAPDSALVARYTARSAEIGLESYAFVLASRCAAALEREQGGVISRPSALPWRAAITACQLQLRHLALSAFRPAECAAADAGLAAAAEDPGLGGGGAGREGDGSRRAAAALRRARRLADAHAAAHLAAYARRAPALAAALGVRAEAGAVFGESALRASSSFPLSQLCQALLRACDAAAGGDGSDCLVGGAAEGVVVSLDRLAPGCLPADAGERPVIALLSAAEGDEEVTSLGRKVTAILLLQELPHLSHLAVRCRQEGVLLATCPPEAPPAAAARDLVGRWARVAGAPEEGSLSVTAASPAAPAAAPAPAAAAAAQPPPAAAAAAAAAGARRTRDAAEVVPLAAAAAQSCGSKAAVCGRLLALAESSGGAFAAPPGAVLPFGCMEASVAAAGQSARYTAALQLLHSAPSPSPQLDAALAETAALLSALRPPAAALAALRAQLGPPPAGQSGYNAVCVRSSANVEDLAGFSSAGLYESLAGVDSGDDEALGSAVARVWASLHTRRAVLARRAAGLAQEAACMAVLVQRQVPSQLCFVLHTAAPGDPSSVLAELAVGMGETLASGRQGSGWRLLARDSRVRTLAFANLSHALLAGAGGAVAESVVDYSRQPLSGGAEAREALGARLEAVGRALQAALGSPQDVEGAVVEGEVYVVQSRPQPL